MCVCVANVCFLASCLQFHMCEMCSSLSLISVLFAAVHYFYIVLDTRMHAHTRMDIFFFFINFLLRASGMRIGHTQAGRKGTRRVRSPVFTGVRVGDCP